MNTRQATKNDFEKLYSLWEKAGLQLYPKDAELSRFESMLSLNPDLCIIAIDTEGKEIGSIFGAFDGRTASIHRLVILPEMQKKGLGSKLVEKLGFKEMTYVKNYYKDL